MAVVKGANDGNRTHVKTTPPLSARNGQTGSLPEVCPGHDLMVPSYLNEVIVPSGPDLVHTGTHSSFYSIRGASDSSGAR